MGTSCRWLFCLREGKGRREKKKVWSHGSSEGGDAARAALSAEEDERLRSFHAESEKEQSRRAMAVAAATAIAADAAVAAARAAAEVVRLASRERGTMFCAGEEERWAAVRIQAAFRAYLARKALRALRGLVKLQALVRGYLVRKKAAETLYSMEALLRAQASVRSEISKSHASKLNPRQSLRSPKIMDIDAYRSPGGRTPARISTSDRRRIPYCRCSLTTHNTPRPKGGTGEDGGHLFQVFDGVPRSPNYMASTRSFVAKARSQSTPRQRKAAAAAEQRRRVSTRRSCSQLNEPGAVGCNSAAIRRLDRSVEEMARDFDLMRLW